MPLLCIGITFIGDAPALASLLRAVAASGATVHGYPRLSTWIAAPEMSVKTAPPGMQVWARLSNLETE